MNICCSHSSHFQGQNYELCEHYLSLRRDIRKERSRNFLTISTPTKTCWQLRQPIKFRSPLCHRKLRSYHLWQGYLTMVSLLGQTTQQRLFSWENVMEETYIVIITCSQSLNTERAKFIFFFSASFPSDIVNWKELSNPFNLPTTLLSLSFSN
jgi:hypothetical protein